MARNIVLLTDFDEEDWFVGTMKGVIQKITPGTNCIDLTHQISPGDIPGASFVLSVSFEYFPQDTVFCAVVDPGVGTERFALAAKIGEFYFVAPDNGILTDVIEKSKADGRRTDFRYISNSTYTLPNASSTFHGRDIFAPVSAHLAGGVSLESFGPECKEPRRINREAPKKADGFWQGEVLYIDRFGNLITNIPIHWVKEAPASYRCEILESSINGLSKTYAEKDPGELVFYPGSSGYLEIGENFGSAAKSTSAIAGSTVVVRF